ncbi:MAG: type IV toxin-antitoxin system AbiEi family antitoxin domain-containing protein [Rothia sp. (in: high G+C Gram-positive bacteria)]|uniref:type IV toxin-antitoxin system AbiEi family antitoxin domain-containing protein n=1 Tax=Rothia sp. (in: high G+C Gram-positive bacteria) TaxID=1885016 RepID=UPI0026DABD07|nr:type IV toxin-antitoxin system AbiEi family antitoxin domain-containing protein [Rothia sp. (in: high G+C Gram-positive bacteria)]MDO4884906.1 type IV toxin-antitoxin system AbiEi family antitoxin domain-containing protein [Rothia sp. (in: high G+C Gram-positive bacteria)]
MGWIDIEKLAGEQHGLFTSAQAVNLGVNRAMITRKKQQGAIEQVRYGVYALASAPNDPHRDMRAAWLSLEPSRTTTERVINRKGPILCATAAAEVYGVGVFYTERYDFYSSTRKQSRDEHVRVRLRNLEKEDLETVDGMLVVSPTVLVCDFLEEYYDLNDVTTLVRDLVDSRRKINWNRVEETTQKVSDGYGIPSEEIFEQLFAPALEVSSAIKSTDPKNELYLPTEVNKYIMENWNQSMQEINRSLRESLKPILQMNIPKINVDIPAIAEVRKSVYKSIAPQLSEIGRRAMDIQDNMYPTLSHLREITENNTLSISNSINKNSSREDV